jgi:low temperature requirement protein LtrA
MAVVEAISIITVSCVWRVISFKHTHLVERIGLLTLIVMGEGVIGLTTSVSTILQNCVQTSKSAIGAIVASVNLIVSLVHISPQGILLRLH